MQEYTVGTILTNKLGEFTKVISLRNGIYGITGWVKKQKKAEEATVATKFVNKFGLKYAGVSIIKKGKVSKEAPKETEPETGDDDELDLTKAKGDDLKAYAEKNDIDITGLKTVGEIREAVIEASKEAEETEE